MTATATAATEQPAPSKGNAAIDWLKAQYALFILIILLIIASVSSDAFLTQTNLTNLLLQMSIIGVVVMAELIVVLTGGIDISVGSALGLAASSPPVLFSGSSVILALIVALIVGGFIGMINGWLVSFRGLEPFIVTLGMLAWPAAWSTPTARASRCSRRQQRPSPRSADDGHRDSRPGDHLDRDRAPHRVPTVPNRVGTQGLRDR